MRKSETYPPLTANGIAASHGIMLYTHPCKNRQVEEKRISASSEPVTVWGSTEPVSVELGIQLIIFLSRILPFGRECKYLGVRKRLLEVCWQPGQQSVGCAPEAHVWKHHGPWRMLLKKKKKKRQRGHRARDRREIRLRTQNMLMPH